MSEAVSSYAIYRQLVTQLLEGREQLPSLPALTLEIRRALDNPNVSLQAMARLITRDAALSALLIKYACSPLHGAGRQPRTLLDALNRLGLAQVGQVTMMHSVRSLAVLVSLDQKRLFRSLWERMTLKAAYSACLARLSGHVRPEEAVLASLLGEVGALNLLAALKNLTGVELETTFQRLCAEYAASLSVLLLKKWAVAPEYSEVARHAGDWLYAGGAGLELSDVLNLGLYHACSDLDGPGSLPLLSDLPAYTKLNPALGLLDESGHLALLRSAAAQAEITATAASLR